MDLSALESSVKALETSLDSVGGWISASTILVVIGLVIEYWLPLRKLIAEIRKRPPFPWKLLMEMAGGVLVTVGVAGELWFQSRASSLQTFIRSDSHKLEALLNNEAALAGKDAAAARRTTALLQSVVMPLDLTDKQQSEIGTACERYSGRSVIVSANSSDIEGRILAPLVIDALIRAGIKATPAPAGGLAFEETAAGLTVRGPDRDFVETLAGSLDRTGELNVAVREPEKEDRAETVISVGVYPFKKPGSQASATVLSSLGAVANMAQQKSGTTGPICEIPIINGTAAPDLSKGSVQRILLTSDTTL